MKLALCVKVVLSSVVLMSLAACNHKPTDNLGGARAMGAPGSDMGGPGMDSGAGAQAYAMQDQRGYQGQVRKDENGEIINPLVAPASQTYYFAFNRSIVQPGEDKAISIQANYLATHPRARIRLEGNTDNRGSREYNVGLGWRRDQSIARIFEQQGVAPKQIRMVSYGKERPAVMGNTEGAWKLNRRVHLVYEAY